MKLIPPLLCLLLLFSGCEQSDSVDDSYSSETGSGPLTIIASTEVLAALTTELAGDSAQVICLETTLTRQQLSGQQISQLQTASLIIVNGAGLESWLQTVSLPKSRLLDTTQSVRSGLLQADGNVSHQHGPNGPQDPASLVHSTWMSPTILQSQCTAIQQRLQKLSIDPETLNERSQKIRAEISTLTARIQKLRKRKLSVLTTTSELGWLTHELGWTQRVVGVDYEEIEEALKQERALMPSKQAKLILATEETNAASNHLIPVTIDLCMETDGNDLLSRLSANLDRLDAAVARVPESNDLPQPAE